MSSRRKIVCRCTVHGCYSHGRSGGDGGGGGGRELGKRTAFQHQLDQAQFDARKWGLNPLGSTHNRPPVASTSRQRPNKPTVPADQPLRSDLGDDAPQEQHAHAVVDNEHSLEMFDSEAFQQYNEVVPSDAGVPTQSDSEDDERIDQEDDNEQSDPADDERADAISLVDEGIFDEIDRELEKQREQPQGDGDLQLDATLELDSVAGLDVFTGPADIDWSNVADSMTATGRTREESLSTENTIDPKRFGTHSEQMGPPRDDVANIKWIRALYLFVSYLGVRHNVSNAAQERILRFVCQIILPYYGHRKRSIVWVRGLWRQLGLSAPFIRYVVCPNKNCFTLHPLAQALVCCACGTRLYHDSADPSRRNPRLEYTYHSLANWLAAVVGEKGMLKHLDYWRLRGSRPDALHDVYDGSRWEQERDYLSSDGVNLLLTLSLDWFQPFKFSDTYSCGPILLTLLNLPPDLRYRTSFTHLAGIVPGPDEPPWSTCHKFLEPLLLELVDLYHGTTVRITDEDGSTRNTRLRAKLFFFVGDTPARSKVCGFCLHSAKDNFCPYCLVSLEERDQRGQGRFPLRSEDNHREESLRVEGLSRAAQEKRGKVSGARFSTLLERSCQRTRPT